MQNIFKEGENKLVDISNLIIPIIIAVIMSYGIIKGVDIYNEFIKGAIEGIKTAFKILPYLIAIFFAINLFRKSGAEELIIQIISPIADLIKFPPQLLSLVIIRPLSGGGAYGIVKNIIDSYGADSYIGRCAAVMMGSAETIFYTAAVYFGAIGIKDSRYTIKAALLSHLAATVAAVIICRIYF